MKTLSAEKRSKYFITNEVAVDERFARKLADNGEMGDQRASLWIAPKINERKPAAVLYLITNGDPVYIGVLNYDEAVLDEDSLDCEPTDDERPAWQVALAEVGIAADTPEEAQDAIYGLWIEEA